MQEDRKRILNMLAEGKITVDEAEKLINALKDNAQPQESAASEDVPRKGKAKFLRIEVNSDDGDRVNVRVPMGLLKSGINFAKFIPGNAQKQVNEALENKGIGFDLNSLNSGNINELVSALGDLEIDVESGEDKVRIYCE